MIDTPGLLSALPVASPRAELQAGQPQAIHRAAAGDEERGGARPASTSRTHESVLTHAQDE